MSYGAGAMKYKVLLKVGNQEVLWDLVDPFRNPPRVSMDNTTLSGVSFPQTEIMLAMHADRILSYSAIRDAKN
jgi:hypothetical protein